MLKKSMLVCFGLLLGLTLLLQAPLLSQQATGKVIGTITDPQGAVVPGATVTVTNTATQVSNKTVTNGQGYFEVTALPIGSYKVAIEEKGFSSAVTQAKELHINESLRFDIQLAVGAEQETVTANAQVANVETADPTIGNSVTTRSIENLPLNGRDVLDLALLQPGVTPANPGSTGSYANGGYSIAGGRTNATTFLLDGGLNTDLLVNQAVLDPNPDAIAEFRILTSNYTAEYGRNAGGIISVVTKSGTNELHGSVFDYLRNDAFNANTFFNKREDLPRNVLKRNQYGATLGGPIDIPRLIDGKNRFFFFVSFQGQRQNASEVQSQIQTFTPAELAGNFSQAVNGGPDPNVVSFLQGHPYFQPNSTLAAQGIIDPSTFNPVAQNYLKLGLLPTSASGLYSSAENQTNNNDELTAKLDFNITSQDRLSATLGGFRSNLIEPYPGGNLPGFPDTTVVHNYFLNLDYLKTFSATKLNDVHFTAQRHWNLQDQPLNQLPSPSSLGFGVSPDVSIGPPLMTFDYSTYAGPSSNGPTTFADVTYSLSDTFTWASGNHTWKFGGSFSPYQDNLRYGYLQSGEFDFVSNSGVGSGNAFADFLMGIPSYYEQGPDAPNNVRTKFTAVFAQDEWRARRNLTLTLGLRYEYSTPKLDTLGRTDNIVPGLQSTRYPNAPLGLVFPGDPGAPRGLNFPDKTNFAPRFGFARPVGQRQDQYPGRVWHVLRHSQCARQH